MPLGLLRSWLNRPASSPLRSRKPMGVELLEDRQLLATSPVSLLLDFGTATSPVAPDYTQVTPVRYSSARGFGWQSTSGLTAINRNTSDPLTRDFHRGRSNTFLADVPNGTYQVTAVLGDASNPLDRVNISAEGRQVASNLSAPAGQTVSPTFQVNVTDGRLNLKFNDRGGRNPYFTLAALNIQAIDPAPTANAGGDRSANEGDTLSFNGAATGGPGLSYLWNFGDGTTAADTLTPTHTYRDSGNFTVSLTVTDAAGRTATSTAAVTLANVAPLVTLNGPSSAAVGERVSFGSQVSDPGQADVEAGFTYLWDFGDGSTSAAANPDFAFASPGSYTVRVTVQDKDGLSGTAASLVEVTAPTASLVVNAGADQNGTEGATIAFNGTAAGGTGALSYLWNFGDGTSTSNTLTPTHTYQDNGTYTAILTVTDAAGVSSSDAAVVNVTNLAPTPLPGGPYAGTAGTPVAFSANATDASSADTQAGFTYLWDFGDGTTSSQRNPSKTYATAGTFTVGLTVTDKDGASATAQTTAAISVTPQPDVLPALPGLLAGFDLGQGLANLVAEGPSASVQGTVPLDAEGAHFDGNGGRVAFNFPSQDMPYLFGSFMVRMRADSFEPGQRIVIAAASGSTLQMPAFSVSITPDGLGVGSGSLHSNSTLGIVPIDAKGTTPIQADEWYTFTVSWDPDYVRFYVNGVLEGTLFKNDGTLNQITIDDYFQAIPPGTLMPVDLGSTTWFNDAQGAPFDGTISHVLLSNQAWDAAQVMQAHTWASNVQTL